jgi:membrane-bound serine protease (ClpP class)
MIMIAQSYLPHKVAGASSYYVASLDMVIDPGAEDFVVTSINDARSVGANHFVLIMNTNGGAGNNMENIINAISDYEGAGNNFTTLIAPVSRHAFSAGAFIAEASNQIWMAPGTTIGSATPIITGIPGEEVNSTLTKVKAAFTTYMEQLTLLHGRNSTATKLMVSAGVSYGAQDAARLHVVTGTLSATTLDDSLAAIGVPAGTPVHNIGIKSQALAIISDPNVDAILFLLGTFAILADLTHPTLILTFVGGAAIALALLGLGLFGASLISIILMMLGAVFIFLEIKTHHGISAMIGVIIFIIGFLLIFHTPPASPPPPGCTSNCLPSFVNFFPIGLITYVILGVIGAGLVVGSLYLYKIREALGHVPVSYDAKSIIGKEGYLTSDLKAGSFATANIASEDWTVTGSVDIPKGARVVVKERSGLKLVVESKKEV